MILLSNGTPLFRKKNNNKQTIDTLNMVRFLFVAWREKNKIKAKIDKKNINKDFIDYKSNLE
ncbi:hypothetical protein DERP_011561 [Dermatophagoides pteronyssinus]|uniref:Uncharacterized protein n=1 Tax=Dermatophagoides pteronyssinus TaxID=6956 RepID=A0ABQ8JCQ5_DERPT|nr:hypothetical protein DERP_011561 [Dermatophagoides pteronyssinus]